MRVLLDTNILLRSASRDDPQYPSVRAKVLELLREGATVFLAPQTLFEFWVVATRPKDVNGLDRSPSDTRREIDKLCNSFVLLVDSTDLVARWLDLCMSYNVRGKNAHDARLVAWMQAHGIDTLLTLNLADFARYDAIQCIGIESRRS